MARITVSSMLFVTLLFLITSTFSLALDTRMPDCGGPHSSCDNCCGNFCCGPEDDCIGGRCRPLPPPPPPPLQAVKEIGMQMQYQESVQWCWIAVATSINHFYNSASSWTQCAVMADVGHRLNGFDPSTTVCPSSDTLSAHADLANALSNPYGSSALYILDGYTPAAEQEYLKSGYVGDPLATTGNFGSFQGAVVSIAAIAAEISAGRPVAVDITWPSGTQHVVAIGGLSPDAVSVLLLDPVNGRTIMKWSDFPARYNGGATINSYVFTKG